MEQPESPSILPNELILSIAANYDAKNELRTTNKYYNNYISKNNIEFIKHPLFTAHKKDVDSIILSAAWYNSIEKEAALRLHYNVKKIRFVTEYKVNSNKPNASRSVSIDQIKLLRDKYNNNNINQSISSYEYSWELEPAIYCAVGCDDLEAIGTISSKLKLYISVDDYTVRNKSNICLLMSLIERDNIHTFKAVVNADPFLVGSDSEFIKVLSNADYISQDLKDKYRHAYKQRKEKSNEQCIIL